MGRLDDVVSELVDLTTDVGPRAPRFSLRRHATSEITGKVHVEQLAFMRDRSPAIHCMCARQVGKTQGDDGILMDAGLFQPDSTNVILGLNGPHIRTTNFEPIWKRMFDRYSGLDRDWRNEGRMATMFPNGARVIFGGTDDARHLKNVLGNRIENGVFIVDECFPAGTLVDERPIETILAGDEVSCVDHTTGRLSRRRVIRTFEKEATELVRLVLGRRNIVCTANHPIFVAGKGYLRASDLQQGDLLCVRSVDDALPDDLLGTVPLREAQPAIDREQLAYGGGEPAAIGVAARLQPDVGSEGPRQGIEGTAPDGSPAEDPGWQRARSDAGRMEAMDADRAAVGTWASDPDARQAGARVRVSDLLQSGSGGPDYEDMYRGRWSKSLQSEGHGREEDCSLEWARLESISRVEPGSSGGTTVYNLEVEGAHTYLANGVLVHNCQDQQNLDELLDSILPPMMGAGARLILSGVFPEVPAGRFWREAGWVERNGQWFQEPSGRFSRHNWGRLSNVHLPDPWGDLQRYLAATGFSINDPRIIRDWQGKPAFDPNATAYRYNQERNGYKAVMPDWLRLLFANGGKDDRGRQLKFCHEMRPDKDGILHGMMASEPKLGVRIFALSIDPGATSDRASIQGIGWGPDFRGSQHLFDWTTLRKSNVSTGDMYAVAAVAYKAFLRMGEAMNPRYDAGSSQNTVDNLQGDYGLPVILAAKKSDKKGQVDRCNDLLTEAKAEIMRGSALEQDLARARWNKAALERGQYEWDRAHHPDSSEAWRYATQDFFESAVPKDKPGQHLYGYQDPIDKARPTINYSQPPGTGESYGGGNIIVPDWQKNSDGGYGGPWGSGSG